MDDRFLTQMRKEPSPGYARALRERLRNVEDQAPARGFRLVPALVSVAGIALVVLVFTVPAVRVAAQNALDMFRVRSFAAVEVDQSRVDQLRAIHDQLGEDPAALVFENPEVLKEPGKPMEYPSADLAGNAAGLPNLRQPRGPLPNGMHFSKATVSGEAAARMTVNTDKLRKVVEMLGLSDVRVPDQLNGQKVTVHRPTIVEQEFESPTNKMTLVESLSPEVSLPPGTDMRQLGEIALRVLGLEPDEARRVASSIDWKSTVVVPVPPTAESFRQVHVNGHTGLLIRFGQTDENGKRRRSGALLLWTEGERVLAMRSDLPSDDVLDVAQSLR